MARVIDWRIHQVAYVENLNPLPIVEPLDRPHQPEVAFLDQIEQGHAAADVAPGDRHHQPQVRFDQAGLSGLAFDAGGDQDRPILGG